MTVTYHGFRSGLWVNASGETADGVTFILSGIPGSEGMDVTIRSSLDMRQAIKVTLPYDLDKAQLERTVRYLIGGQKIARAA